MLAFDTPAHQERLNGGWQVIAAALGDDRLPDAQAFADRAHAVPEATHLQLALYPERPYWGEHLRRLNEQAWWYRYTFAGPTIPFQRARLRFGGVDYDAAVWLNGQPVGAHEGAFVPFDLDVTAALLPGEQNELLVRVAAPWDEPNPRGSYPINHVLRGLVKGLYEHGEGVIPPNVNPLGIWRPVSLLLDDGLSLDRARIVTDLDGTLHLRCTAHNATGAPWRGTLALDVAGDNHDGPGVAATVPVELPPGERAITHTLAVPDPRLWWPWDHGRADLYRLEARLQDTSGTTQSTLSETFGIRTVRLERSPERFTYYINERPVFLRGSSYMPGVYLSQHDADSLAADVALARAAYLNMLRVHVHVSPPELYGICDRAGILLWQDFELNWVQEPSPAFEARALVLQRDMIDMLGNHPAIISWICHNEPTMVFAHRENYEQHPDPALYAAACQQDDSRPVFICSGQMEDDWQRAGDIHTYYGAIWSRHYTDVYQHAMRLNTEFGFEAPAAIATLKQYPDAWERLDHLEGQIDELWAYQAELIQFHVEHLRRTRPLGSAGYVHFWLKDLVPQVGCGVVDVAGVQKGGYAALQRASQPVLPVLEHDGKALKALWVCNDTPQAYPGARVTWTAMDDSGRVTLSGETVVDVPANDVLLALPLAGLAIEAAECARVSLFLRDVAGEVIASNAYTNPLRPRQRPRGYPWKFDSYLGYKVFDRPGAPSLVDQTGNGLIQIVPLALRESLAEWGMRQKLPLWALSLAARLTKPFVQGD